MVYQSGGRGTLIVDLVIRGIPIRRATGCPNTRRGRQDYEAIRAMLRSFGDPATERLDVLRDVAAKRVTIAAVWAAYRRGDLDRLATGPQLTADLRTAWEAWHRREGGGNTNNRKYALAALLRPHPTARVAELPALVRALRVHYQGTAQPRTFNQHRVLVLAFLRDTLGKRHALRGEVADIPPLPYLARHGHPVTVREALGIRHQLPAPHGETWWALCTTGLRSKEYFEAQWTPVHATLEVAGTKNRSATRTVPLLEAIPAPATRYKAFRAALAKATGGSVTPHDARRSYRIWLREAGVARVDRDVILGHAGRDMEAIYEHREGAQMLRRVADALRRYIHQQRKAGLRRVG